MISSLHLHPMAAAAIMAVRDVLWFAYTIYMHGKHGQTCGKMVCKIRVVNHHDEQPITFRQAAIRDGIPLILTALGSLYFIGSVGTGHISQAEVETGAYINDRSFMILTFLSSGWFIIESITMLTNEKRRAIHDYIAGTVVIRTNLAPEASPIA